MYSFETRGKDLINGFHSAEIQPKLRRGASTVFFENAIEIRDVVEAALIADFRNALVGFDQLSGSGSQPDLDQELNK